MLLLLAGQIVILVRCACGETARARWPESWARCECGERVAYGRPIGRA